MIQVGSYTGDGSGAGRVITPGGGTRNLAAVIVLRLDGTTYRNYMRLRNFPNTRSAPLEHTDAATDVDNGMLDKITAMSATTFTVGADLNVNLDAYWFITFDQESGFVEIGQYVGNGGLREENTNLTLGPTSFSAPTSIIGQGLAPAEAVGKVIETNSAHARGSGVPICDPITAVTLGVNPQVLTASMNPGFTSGTLLGTQWQLRAREITLPFAPDLLFVIRMTVTGDAGMQGAGTQGQFCWWSRASSAIDRDNRDMEQPNGAGGRGVLYKARDSNILNVATFQREDSGADGDEGPNINGQTYFWLAIRQGGPNRLRRVDHIGNGDANPVHFHGGGFDPNFILYLEDRLDAFAENRIHANQTPPGANHAQFGNGLARETGPLATYETSPRGFHWAGAGSGLPLNRNNVRYMALIGLSGHNYDWYGHVGGNRSLYMSHPNDQGEDLAMSHPNDQGSLVLSHPNDQGDDLVMSI